MTSSRTKPPSSPSRKGPRGSDGKTPCAAESHSGSRRRSHIPAAKTHGSRRKTKSPAKRRGGLHLKAQRQEQKPFSSREILRYGRQLILPDVGLRGQHRLRDASVLLVGAGGLSSPAALYLAAAGVGMLGLVDFDTVELGNLQRQILHSTPDVGRRKLDSAAEKVFSLNPNVEVRCHEVRLGRDNAMDIIQEYNVVIDGSDNYPTRYLTNDACRLLEVPDVYGAVFRFEGQLSVFDGSRGPCYRCLYPEPPPVEMIPGCADAGVLGTTPGVIGTLQAVEAVKLILGLGRILSGKLLLYDALAARFQELQVLKNPACPLCGRRRTLKDLPDYDSFCGTGRTAEATGGREAQPAHSLQIAPVELKELLNSDDPPLLLDVRESHEHEICRIEGARLLPLSRLPEALDELPADREVVVYCHIGTKAIAAAKLLRDAGCRNAKSLSGGIDAWASEVDRKMPRY